MSDLEKTFLVMTGADAAFEILSDPVRIADYVPTLELADSTAVDGELDVDADLKARDGVPAGAFTADRPTGRIEWGRPAPDYGGSISIVAGTANTARVTLQLHLREGLGDTGDVTRLFDQAVDNIRGMLSRR
jgi:hypothetical protein